MKNPVSLSVGQAGNPQKDVKEIEPILSLTKNSNIHLPLHIYYVRESHFSNKTFSRLFCGKNELIGHSTKATLSDNYLKLTNLYFSIVCS